MTDIYDRFDAATRSIDGYALLWHGRPAGRLVFKHGAACTAYLQLWGAAMVSARVTGGGFDRSTAALENAAAKLTEALADPDFEAARRALLEALPTKPEGEGWANFLAGVGFVVAGVTN
jgi:hypothetical protein